MSKDVPSADVLLMPAALCAVGLPHIVTVQVMATDAKSNAAANLLRFPFIDVFLLVFGFAFGCLPFAIQFSEIRNEVPEKFQKDWIFRSAFARATVSQAADFARSCKLR